MVILSFWIGRFKKELLVKYSVLLTGWPQEFSEGICGVQHDMGYDKNVSIPQVAAFSRFLAT
jgi:hypothetical protein